MGDSASRWQKEEKLTGDNQKKTISYEKHAQELQEMIDSMVDVMSSAIDALTPFNGNHTRNMCRYAENFLRWMNGQLEENKNPNSSIKNRNLGNLTAFENSKRDGTSENANESSNYDELLEAGYHYTDEEEIRRFILAVRLHDVGKLVTPLPVMNKKTRLGGYDVRVLERFKLIGALDRIAFLEGHMEEKTYIDRKEELARAKDFVESVDGICELPKGALEYIKKLAKLTYLDENGETLCWLDPFEVKKLSISSGTLTAEERHAMEKHVKYTAKLLSQMKFPEADWEVPLWAADHHELLDGSGYPAKKKGDEIGWHVRLLTILDVFDALTARDRPYKKPTDIDKALEILEEMVREGKIDGQLMALFKKSEAWKTKR